MKKIFTPVLVVVALLLTATGCTKRGYSDIDERYWLNQERGVVVYSSLDCSYYVVETYNGYTVMRASGGILPYEGDVLYGDLSHYGYSTFYNRSAGFLVNASVTEYWLNYYDAQYVIDSYCY